MRGGEERDCGDRDVYAEVAGHALGGDGGWEVDGKRGEGVVNYRTSIERDVSSHATDLSPERKYKTGAWKLALQFVMAVNPAWSLRPLPPPRR